MTKPPTTKSQVPANETPTLAGLANRLRHAIFKLSNHPKTEMVALLQRYMGFLALSMVKYGTERFPRTLRPQARTYTDDKGKQQITYNFDRSTESTKASLLVFHVATGIAAYFDVVNSITGKATQEQLDKAMFIFEERVCLVEDIAKRTINGYQVHGSPGLGFCLMTPEQIASWEAKSAVSNAKKAEGPKLPSA
jgi:hypothetical protein